MSDKMFFLLTVYGLTVAVDGDMSRVTAISTPRDAFKILVPLHSQLRDLGDWERGFMHFYVLQLALLYCALNNLQYWTRSWTICA